MSEDIRPKDNNVMCDLETYDTAPSAIILSIGAVRFDTNNCYQRIYLVCCAPNHLLDQTAHGRTTSKSTLEWWEKQSSEARAVLTDPNAISPEEALARFRAFLGFNAKLWGNGSDFDNVLLGSMYHSYGQHIPWKYSSNRCFRTLRNLVPNIPVPVREGTYHNALDDAVYQALWAQLALQRLGVTL